MALHEAVVNVELDHLTTLINDLYILEDQVEELKQRIHAHVKHVADSTVDASARTVLMHYVYWDVPEVLVSSIAEAFLGNAGLAAQIGRLVGPMNHDVYCQRCLTPILVKNRTELHRLMQKQRRAAKGIQPLVCNTCHRADMQRDQVRWHQFQMMPYAAFRRTEEWRNQRAHALAYYQAVCQECGSSNDSVDVYHRADAAHWHDTIAELLVLCHRCYRAGTQAGTVKVIIK